MTFVITSSCIGVKDQSCVEVCPVDCIHQAATMFVIDPEACIDCGACESECPAAAIVRDDDLSPEDEPFREINIAIARGTAAVDALVSVLMPRSPD